MNSAPRPGRLRASMVPPCACRCAGRATGPGRSLRCCLERERSTRKNGSKSRPQVGGRDSRARRRSTRTRDAERLLRPAETLTVRSREGVPERVLEEVAERACEPGRGPRARRARAAPGQRGRPGGNPGTARTASARSAPGRGSPAGDRGRRGDAPARGARSTKHLHRGDVRSIRFGGSPSGRGRAPPSNASGASGARGSRPGEGDRGPDHLADAADHRVECVRQLPELVVAAPRDGGVQVSLQETAATPRRSDRGGRDPGAGSREPAPPAARSPRSGPPPDGRARYACAGESGGTNGRRRRPRPDHDPLADAGLRQSRPTAGGDGVQRRNVVVGGPGSPRPLVADAQVVPRRGGTRGPGPRSEAARSSADSSNRPFRVRSSAGRSTARNATPIRSGTGRPPP